ncbi:MAG: PAS domain S-box protein [Bacteroidales bacterium]|nr:PAS domain S-box protein [Bacteroidales bacterium]
MIRTDLEIKMIYDEFNNMVKQLNQRDSQRLMAQKALMENELKYRELSDMLPQSIYETDHGGNFTYVNKAWHEKFGYTKRDLDNGLNLMQVIETNDLGKLLADGMGQSYEYLAMTKGGTRFPALIYTSSVLHDQKIVGTRG